MDIMLYTGPNGCMLVKHDSIWSCCDPKDYFVVALHLCKKSMLRTNLKHFLGQVMRLKAHIC